MKISTEPKERVYPSLRRYSLCGEEIIVLFEDETSGTVLKSNVQRHQVGNYKTDWKPDQFQYYAGKITLEN